jgi:hypothetical protein
MIIYDKATIAVDALVVIDSESENK